jgi:ATP-dependent DNA helicase RecG
MTGYGFDIPLIEVDSDWFSITFHRPPKTTAQAQKIKKTARATGEKGSRKTSGKTSGKIIELIKENEFITIPEIAERIGITERSVERNIQNLQKERIICRVGPAKGGHWEVVDEK